MGTYLMMLYVSLEQEKAVKNLFNTKGWGFKKPDLSMTTDKLGPTYASVDDNESESEGETTSKGRTRSRPATRESSKRTPAVKIIKQSPKSEKKTSKVRVQLRKGGKKSTENAEFQEILEEAELITASINPADDEGEGEEIEPFTVKVERDGNMGEDSDYVGEDGESNDEDMDDDFDDVTPSTSYLEAGAESTDISQETADTPKPAKRRKVTTKARARPTLPPVDMDDLEAMGDLSPIKGRRQYTRSALFQAFNSVQKGIYSVAKAAKVYGVPTQTLRDRVKGKVNVEAERGGPGPLFTRDEEKNMVDYLMDLYNLGYGFSKLEIASVCSDYAVYLGKRERTDPVGVSLVRKTFDRWTEAKKIDRINKKPLPSLFSYYFDQLERTMLENKFDKSPNLIVAITFIEIRQGDSDSSEEQILATVVACATASGHSIPPFFVFPGKQMKVDFMKGALPGSSGVVSGDGRVNSEVFLQFLTEHVLRNVPDYKEGQDILVHVNGAKYCSVGIMELARSMNMILFFPPAKATGVLQPLDLGCVEPFKELYTTECENHMIMTSTNISVGNVCELVCKVYQKAFSAGHVTDGFSQAGLYPCDRLHVVVKDSEQVAVDARKTF